MLRWIWTTLNLQNSRLAPFFFLFIQAVCLVLLTTRIAIADPLNDCKDLLPFGVPELTVDAHTTAVCHTGYVALHDDDYLVPRWVAYTLNGKKTFGCIARSNKFHPDDALSPDRRATPADYRGTGYDQGHQAPAQDFAWNKDLMFDSFSMLNMAPQKPALNRQGWKRLEEIVRVWASDRGNLVVYVGPVLLKRNKPRTIGRHKVAVPQEFWKVIVDIEKKEALAFVMPQAKVPAGKLDEWTTSIADVERIAGVKLALPPGVDRKDTPKLWPAELSAWKTKKKALCSKRGRSRS
jgi:endonuclease G